MLHPFGVPPVRYFNPLPRKEGDDHGQKLAEGRKPNFNPLPRKEGDQSVARPNIQTLYFNPLPRKEGDPGTNQPILPKGRISIHSLVKRETPDSGSGFFAAGDFNPLPRKEGDCWA